MTEYLAIFHSRTQAIECNKRLNKLGYPTTLMPTPEEAHIGCGYSIKIPTAYINQVRNTIDRMSYSGFYGYMKINKK
jgi:hypothetical protein